MNLVGVANLSYLVGQQMIGQGYGRIVNVSSRGAFRGEPTAPAYGASKAGLNAMSQSLAKYLAPYNIFVGVVAPGFVETEMAAEHLAGETGDGIRGQSPLNRVATPDEVAYPVLFLAAGRHPIPHRSHHRRQRRVLLAHLIHLSKPDKFTQKRCHRETP